MVSYILNTSTILNLSEYKYSPSYFLSDINCVECKNMIKKGQPGYRKNYHSLFHSCKFCCADTALKECGIQLANVDGTIRNIFNDILLKIQNIDMNILDMLEKHRCITEEQFKQLILIKEMM